MTKQSKNDQVNGENQISEQVNFSECIQELDADDLSEVAGAGVGNAIKGWNAATKYGGNWTVKVKSSWHGLTHSSPGSSEKTNWYAWNKSLSD